MLIFSLLLNMQSHPTWVRGLKQYKVGSYVYGTQVAPYVGAWIETSIRASIDSATKVAPYVGAWIETCDFALHSLGKRSHPTWVRGLKPTLSSNSFCNMGRTLRGCVD